MRENRIACLDGLRGIAALWVLVGHATLLTRLNLPLVGDPDLGVDLFILLSGFLMVFHYVLREQREPWDDVSTWSSFWKRRYFRIAPLYYLMLIAAMALGPELYGARTIIDTFNGVPLQPAPRYLDQSLENWITHFSFIFGAIPANSYETPLPDWSIGLEMQFYAALPFLMLVVKRLGFLAGTTLITLIGVTVALFCSHVGLHFPMPSFLPLKINIFAAGMVLAGMLGSERKIVWLSALCAVVFVLIPIGGEHDRFHLAIRLTIVVAFFTLIHHDTLPAPLSRLANRIGMLLGGKFCHNLGELSFGVYLVHLVIMQPVVAYLITFHPMSSPVRWLVTVAVTVPVSYGIAAVGYRFVEKPGQSLGRFFARKRVAAA